jgi:hypothetical protein
VTLAASFGVFLLSDSFLRSSLQKFFFIGKKNHFLLALSSLRLASWTSVDLSSSLSFRSRFSRFRESFSVLVFLVADSNYEFFFVNSAS